MALEWLLDAVDAGLPSRTCEQWSYLARLLPWLLLYDDRDPEAAQQHRVTQGADTPVGARRRVVDRLILAEQGQWHTLIRNAIDAERAHCHAAMSAAAKAQAQHHPGLFARVVRHALAGSLKAAKRLLLGAETLPPCDATTKAVLELYKSTPDQAHATLPPPPSPGPRRVNTKDVTKKVRALRVSAQPGPNQERNAHVEEVLFCPRGAPTLARWCEAWRTNTLPTAVRQQWLFSHAIALDKGGGKARPILLQEALLKLATGTIVQIHQPRIQRAVGAFQHGLGGTVGAPQVVWQVRAAMAAEPYATYLGIDCRNAFGTITRPAVAAEADTQVPQIATLLRAMWHDVTPRMLIRQRDGTLADHPVVDGLAQGGCDSQPAFCLGIARALRNFQEHCAKRGIRVKVWAYVDDVVLQVLPEHTTTAIHILDAAFTEVGLERRPDKCRWFVPGANSTATYPPEVGAPAHGGLPILGSAADGAYRAVIGSSDADATTEPARERLAQARQLAQRIRDLLHANTEVPVLHAAYKLTSGVLNQALSYDICVLPAASIGAIASQLDEVVIEVIRHIVGAGWTDTTEALLRLPRADGGCGLLSVQDRAHTAFLSTLLRCPPAVTDTPAAWQEAGVLAACEDSIAWLRAQGVWLDAWAMPRTQSPGEGDSLTAATLPTIPLPGRQPLWRSSLAQLRARALAKEVPYLGSRGGQEGGALLNANGGDMQVDLTDGEFRDYIRMRLGLPVCTHQRCQHRAAADQGKVCPQVSDPLGYHALLCKLGGGLTRTHNAVCSILLQAARAAGYSALKEQVIAELATAGRKEPRVDVDAWGLVAEPRLLLDVTVTCPFAERYADKSSVQCGEHRKDNEYPAAAGLAFTGIAVDVFGKHGPALHDLLTRLADSARQHELDQGTQPRRWLNRWRTRISTEIARGCSKLIRSANTSTAPKQQPPQLATATAKQPGTPETNAQPMCSQSEACHAPVSASSGSATCVYSSYRGHHHHHQAEGATVVVQHTVAPASVPEAAAVVQPVLPFSASSTTAHPTVPVGCMKT